MNMRILDGEAAQGLIGIWTWHIGNNLVIACDRVCEHIDVPPEQGLHGILPERFIAAIHPDDRANLMVSTRTAMDGRNTFGAEYRILSKLHGVRWVRSTGRCFRDAQGRLTHISGYLTQIDEPSLPAPPRSAEAQEGELVDHLIQARDLAGALGHEMLRRLIEATLLEAAHAIAERLKRSETE
ncbi:PAS domain-containing protein [Aureimonas ureilytica]|uniref:PAS domain-containing protein n=1 Tax=Aureimonas ureilytica TaxID=401562 RepID=UPI0003825659|nr:PAS domain-containing protein [Aureimonas ureilytica]